MGSDISTDDIMRRVPCVLPYWSNIPKAASFVFVDNTYPRRATELRDRGGHAIVAADELRPGLEPRERRPGAALSGAHTVVANFARIHWQNLANFGVCR